jgi:hypothetical protein
MYIYIFRICTSPVEEEDEDEEEGANSKGLCCFRSWIGIHLRIEHCSHGCTQATAPVAYRLGVAELAM